MSDEKQEVIRVTIDDDAAQAAVDKLLSKLQQAKDLAASIRVRGGGGGGGSGGGGSDSGGGGGGGGSGGGRGGGGGANGPSGGGEGSPPGMNFNDRDTLFERAAFASQAAAQSAANAFLGGASDPAWGIRLLGQSVRVIGNAAQQGLGEILKVIPGGKSWVGRLAKGLFGVSGTLFDAWMNIKAAGVDARYARVQELANLERPIEIARVTGGRDVRPGSAAMERAAAWGYTPSQAIPTLAMYYSSIGSKGAGAAPDPWQLLSSGLSPEIVARYIALGGRGGGATQGVGGASGAVLRAIGLAQGPGFDLRGARVDELLSRIASSVTMMAEQGISVDLEAVNQGMLSLAQSGHFYRSQTGGRNVFGGMHAPRAIGKLMTLGPQAAQGFAGQFGGLTDAALQSYAFGQAASPLDAIRLLQQLAADPLRARAVIGDTLGPEAGALALAGRGFSAEQAAVLMSDYRGPGGGVPGSLGGATTGAFPYSSTVAGQEDRLLQITDKMLNQPLLNAVFEVNKTLIGISEGAEDFIGLMTEFVRWVGK